MSRDLDFYMIQYIDYMKSLAGKHASTKGFYIMDINEILNDMRSDLQYPAFMLHRIDGYITMPNRDNILNTVNSGFIIVDHLAKVDHWPSMMNIYHNTFTIGREFLSRMMWDVKQNQAYFKQLFPDTIKYEMLDGIFDNDFGWLFTFDIECEIHDFSYDPANWSQSIKAGMVGY